jgi:hypothetical protein
MWFMWECPHCKRYYEEIAIDEHKEVCDGSTTKGKKTMQEGGVQERTRSASSPERTT